MAQVEGVGCRFLDGYGAGGSVGNLLAWRVWLVLVFL